MVNKLPDYLFGKMDHSQKLPLETWCSGFSDLPEYLAGSCSLHLLPVLAAKTSGVRLENLQTARVPNRSQCSILAQLLLQNKLSWEEGTDNLFVNAVAPLAAGLDLSCKSGYAEFMDRLMNWKPLGDERHADAIASMPDGLKLLRPELIPFVGSAINADACFDLSKFEEQYSIKLKELLHETEWFKYKLIAAFLEQGDEEHVHDLVQGWLSSPPSSAASQWLFQQNLHPNNTLFEEHFNYNVLLKAALEHFPPPPRNSFPKEAECDVSEMPDRVRGFVRRPPDGWLNRTLIWRNEDRIEYLKIQNVDEASDDFLKQYSRMGYLHEQKDALGLKSTCPETHGIYCCDLSGFELDTEEKAALLEKTGANPRLVMHFSMPASKPYELYVNDSEVSPEAAREGLLSYANDYGLLWRQGINGPDCLSVYHDKASGRAFHFLAELAHVINIGVIDEWRTSTRFPNVGPSGMRDQGDAHPCEECGLYQLSTAASSTGGSFSYDFMLVNPASPVDINKVRLLELAKTAWGLVLLWGDRYNSAIDRGLDPADYSFDPYAINALTTLFSQAFGMKPEECEALIRQDGLYDQAIREFKLWLDNNHAEYVSEMRTSLLNRENYPHLSERMELPKFTDSQMSSITDHGFITASTEDSSKPDTLHTHLGARPNGRNPLFAFNAIIARLITHGCTESGNVEA